jgi:predicted nucleotidyltransferase
MENYAEAGNEDRLYEDEGDLLQAEGFDLTIAGIRLLGRDMGAMATGATGREVRAILEVECGGNQRYRLVQDMIREERLRDRFDEVLAKLKKLHQGLIEQQA